MPALIFLIVSYFRTLINVAKDPIVRGLVLFIIIYILGGALFYHQIEGWSYINAVYFCVVTLATVGYGDFTPTTTAGRIFTIFYIMLGIGTFVSFATALAQNILKRRNKRRGSSN